METITDLFSSSLTRFGRGYSDAPFDLPQDERLFSTQILLALSSSPISWTGSGSGKFSLVGYSLGGGIVTAFASYFPHLLRQLVLLAPSGLIRSEHITFKTQFLYSHGLMPETILTAIVKRRLVAGPLVSPKKEPQGKQFSAEDALTEELNAQKNSANKSVLSRAYPGLVLTDVVNWQAHTHSGFVPSFMSSMRFGPILKERQLGTWQRLGRILAGSSAGREGLTADRVLILGGINDPIIIKDELVEDVTAALGGNVQFKFFEAGHEFPSTKYDEVADIIQENRGR